MGWRSAPSVKSALSEASRRWPARSKAHDGTIGDAAHSARKSDHNPDDRGIVHAFDITHDPAHGVDCEQLLRMIVARRDHRLRYAIWRGRITYGPHAASVRRKERGAWTSEPYRGPNPHTKHLHVSIGYTEGCETDTAPWWELPKPPPPRVVAKPASTLPVHNPATRELSLKSPQMRGTDVAIVQRAVKVKADGIFGPGTRAAVVAFQRARRMSGDGIVGPKTWARIMAKPA